MFISFQDIRTAQSPRLTEKELRELFEEVCARCDLKSRHVSMPRQQADMGPMDQDIWDDEEEEMRRADEGYLGFFSGFH